MPVPSGFVNPAQFPIFTPSQPDTTHLVAIRNRSGSATAVLVDYGQLAPVLGDGSVLASKLDSGSLQQLLFELGFSQGSGGSGDSFTVKATATDPSPSTLDNKILSSAEIEVLPTTTSLSMRLKDGSVLASKLDSGSLQQLLYGLGFGSTSSGGGGLTPEDVQDIIASTLQAGLGIIIDYNDPGNIITIASDFNAIPDGSLLATKLNPDSLASLLYNLGFGAASPAVSGLPTVGAYVYRSSNQTLTGGGSDTVISWDTQVTDEADYWSAGQPTRFTIPETGWYFIGSGLTANGSSISSPHWFYYIRLNGSAVILRNGQGFSSINFPVTTVNGVYQLTAGDYLEAVMFNGGTTQTLLGGLGENYFQIVRMGGGTSLTWSTVTGNTTALVNNGYICNPATTMTLTLPPTPAVGGTVALSLIGGTSVTISLNGGKFKGYANDRIVKSSSGLNEVVTLVYTGTTQGWVTDSPVSVCRAAFWDKFTAYYGFNESGDGGFRFDSVGNNHTTQSVDVPTYKFNNISSGEFSNSQSFEVPDGAAFDIANDLTIIAGVRKKVGFPGAVNYEGIFCKDIVGDRAYQLLVNGDTSGKWGLTVFNPSNVGTSVSWSGTPATNTNYFVRAWHDDTANRIRIRIDETGTPDEVVYTDTIRLSGVSPTIGRLLQDTPGAFRYNGYLFFVGISNQIFTDAEAAEMYNGGAYLKHPDS